MKVLALISGGKDSIFNIVKCIENNHQIVALGNLYNLSKYLKIEGDGQQIDSYMYQTVGTNISFAIAQALNKPLFRKQIKGKPKITNINYQGDKQGDQVQDLFELVKEAREKYPQLNSISSGAIFSTYQKNRVENIFNMISLAYLWQKDQSELIQQMVNYPINAILIKVASYGLNKSHLGKTIKQLLPLFYKLKQQCGMNVCGEGGQFESLVLDCPLFLKKIIIDQCQIIQVDKNQLAPVAYLKIKQYHLEQK